MKSVFALILFSLGLVITSAWNLNEKPTFIPLATTQNQRQKSRNLALFPQPKLTVQQFLQLKHPLELKCLKDLCNDERYRHICYGGKPFQSNKSMPLPQTFPQGKIVHFRMITDSPLALRRQSGVNEYIPEGKAYYLQPNKYHNNLRMGSPVEAELRMKSYTQQNLNKTAKTVQKENLIGQPQPQRNDDRKNSSQETGAVVNTTSKTSTEVKPQNSSLVSAKYQTPETSTHQYEVREIIEEYPDVSNVSNNFKGFQLGGKKLTSVSFAQKPKGESRIRDNQKSNISSTTLKRLAVGTPHPKPSLRPRVLIDKSNEPEMKSLFTDYIRNWKENTTAEPKTQTMKYNSSLRAEHVNKSKSLRTTTETDKYTSLLYTSSGVVKTKYNRSGLTKASEPLGNIQMLGSIHPNDPNFFPISTTNYFTSHIKPVALSSPEIQTTSSIVWKTSDGWRFEKDSSSSLTSERTARTTEFFSGAAVNEVDLTTPTFKEITEEPRSFDLFTKIKEEMKKDFDSTSKNSRKIHFEEKPRKSGTSKQVSETPQRRRSDILISDYDDYFDYENTLPGGNYLKKLQQNHSLEFQNLTSDMIIPLIPTVVNDLREGKIPPEDISALSEMFGTYWPTVMQLSNNTMLDMLLLMKMKNENDLKNLVQSLKETKTTEIDDYNFNNYDFLENYKDLYQELPVEESENSDYNFGIIDITPQY